MYENEKTKSAHLTFLKNADKFTILIFFKENLNNDFKFSASRFCVIFQLFFTTMMLM